MLSVAVSEELRGEEMKDKNIPTLLMILMWLMILGAIAFGIVALVKYGNKPITEVPMWALWMFRK